MSGGWTSTLNLWSHCGGKIKWDNQLNTLVPDETKQSTNELGQSFISVVGSARGQFWPSELFDNMEVVIKNICEIFNLKKIKYEKYQIKEII